MNITENIKRFLRPRKKMNQLEVLPKVFAPIVGEGRSGKAIITNL
jgi:hypothetical protein